MGARLLRFRQTGPAYLLAWLLLGLFFGVFLGVNPPQLGRTMILLPAAAILSALSMDALYALARDALSRVSLATGLFATGLVILVFVNIGVQNWMTYVRTRGGYAMPRARIGRYLADQPPSARAILITTLGGWSENNEEFRFLAPGILVGTLTPDLVPTGVTAAGSPTILILPWDQAEFAQSLPGLFPGEILTPVAGTASNEVAFYAFEIP